MTTLTLNVPLKEAKPLKNVSGNLVPFERGLRLPFSFYLDRITRDGIKVEHHNSRTKNSLIFTFPK